MTEGNGQCRRQYENVSNQFNECIQNCQHIRQWCARRRHNSQQIELFVFSGVFSSPALSATSDLMSARFFLFINCSAFLSVSTFAFSWTLMISLSEITCTCFCSNNGLSFNKEGWLCSSPLQPSQYHSALFDYSPWVHLSPRYPPPQVVALIPRSTPSNSWCRRLLHAHADILTLTWIHMTQKQREHSLSAS